MDITEIMELLPHRNIFLMVDKVLELTEEKIVTQKNVTITEPFFTGHFPRVPIFPGVLIVENMAQSCGLLSRKVIPRENGAREGFLIGVDKLKIYKKVIPGDVLESTCEFKKKVMDYLIFKCKVTAGDKKVASGEITLLLNKTDNG